MGPLLVPTPPRLGQLRLSSSAQAQRIVVLAGTSPAGRSGRSHPTGCRQDTSTTGRSTTRTTASRRRRTEKAGGNWLPLFV